MLFATIAGGEVLSEHYLIKNKPFPGAMPGSGSREQDGPLSIVAMKSREPLPSS